MPTKVKRYRAHGCNEKDCTFKEKLYWPERYIFKIARQRLAPDVASCKMRPK
jgi:hypothetical protein